MGMSESEDQISLELIHQLISGSVDKALLPVVTTLNERQDAVEISKIFVFSPLKIFLPSLNLPFLLLNIHRSLKVLLSATFVQPHQGSARPDFDGRDRDRD